MSRDTLEVVALLGLAFVIWMTAWISEPLGAFLLLICAWCCIVVWCVCVTWPEVDMVDRIANATQRLWQSLKMLTSRGQMHQGLLDDTKLCVDCDVSGCNTDCADPYIYCVTLLKQIRREPHDEKYYSSAVTTTV